MPRDDDALFIDQDRVGEAELLDRGLDLLELPLGMRSCITRIGLEAADRPVFDRKGFIAILNPPQCPS